MYGYGYAFPVPTAVVTPEQVRAMANARAQNASDGLIEPPRDLNVPQPAPSVPMPYLGHIDRVKLREAALRATRVYPGCVGALISKELLAWESFAFRFGSDGMIAQLVDHVMSLPLPEPEAAAVAA